MFSSYSNNDCRDWNPLEHVMYLTKLFCHLYLTSFDIRTIEYPLDFKYFINDKHTMYTIHMYLDNACTDINYFC